MVWLAVMPIFIIGGAAGAALWMIWQIFLEVRSIRRMMNADRRISNEVQEFDD